MVPQSPSHSIHDFVPHGALGPAGSYSFRAWRFSFSASLCRWSLWLCTFAFWSLMCSSDPSLLFTVGNRGQPIPIGVVSPPALSSSASYHFSLYSCTRALCYHSCVHLTPRLTHIARVEPHTVPLFSSLYPAAENKMLPCTTTVTRSPALPAVSSAAPFLVM